MSITLQHSETDCNNEFLNISKKIVKSFAPVRIKIFKLFYVCVFLPIKICVCTHAHVYTYARVYGRNTFLTKTNDAYSP
ncbi:hypothetical protein [Staphylococcus phage PT1-4]